MVKIFLERKRRQNQMTKKISIFLAMVMVVSALALSACGNGKETTTPTTTQPTTTTTQPTTTTTQPTTTEPTTTEPTTTEPTTTEPGGGEPTAENAPAITSHATGTGYDGLCGICHMIGGTDPMPDDGFHPDFDVAECYDCHKAG
jgi:ABC-type transport system substrate-binding protein